MSNGKKWEYHIIMGTWKSEGSNFVNREIPPKWIFMRRSKKFFQKFFIFNCNSEDEVEVLMSCKVPRFHRRQMNFYMQKVSWRLSHFFKIERNNFPTLFKDCDASKLLYASSVLQWHRPDVDSVSLWPGVATNTFFLSTWK